jgi:hypothetical protein
LESGLGRDVGKVGDKTSRYHLPDKEDCNQGEHDRFEAFLSVQRHAQDHLHLNSRERTPRSSSGASEGSLTKDEQ